MNIKVLGPGCANCRTLERRTREALQQLSIDAEVEKIEDYQRIASYGILRTPGLVINEKLVWQGGVPTPERVRELIATHVETN